MPVLFRNRADAGRVLAEKIVRLGLRDPVVFGIPNGGIPVGLPVAEALYCPLDVMVLRKIKIPEKSQACCGVVTLDRTFILNEYVLESLGLEKKDIEPGICKVYADVLQRDSFYRDFRPFPDLTSRTVVIVDDGLATGYTMLTAVKLARKNMASSVIAAAPVSSGKAFELLRTHTDSMVVLNVDRGDGFSISNFYEDFPDMCDKEALSILRLSENRAA
jgi:putative phosphoribosyl transferase